MDVNDNADWMRECSVCYKRGFEYSFIICEGCGALLYCSPECQHSDWEGEGEEEECSSDERCHQQFCPLFKAFTARQQELSDLPFTFKPETTDPRFHQGRLKEFLRQHGVLGKGMWKRETPLLHSSQSHIQCDEEEGWGLAAEGAILSSPLPSPPSLQQPLTDWQLYFSFRGLPLSSPVAMVLTYPLTLYYILTTRLREDAPSVFQRLCEGEVGEVHIVGVEREVEMKAAFLEFARLVPCWRLHITMFGRQIPKAAHRSEWEKENLRISVQRSLYHQAQASRVHVAVGFNAGLPAYPSWPATLKKLHEEETPAYFTDQSEYSCHSVASSIAALGIPAISPVTVNPFRSPARIVTREQNMPWYSNAFLFRLLYEPP